jgi:hypothetical protein
MEWRVIKFGIRVKVGLLLLSERSGVSETRTRMGKWKVLNDLQRVYRIRIQGYIYGYYVTTTLSLCIVRLDSFVDSSRVRVVEGNFCFYLSFHFICKYK